jgi:short-subunit dehydrogenase
MIEIRQKVVIITGASSGIGLSTARQLAANGARLLLAARRESRLQEICQEIQQAGGEAIYTVTDVSQETAVEQMVATCLTHYGRVDVLINNAGYGYALPLANTPSADFHNIMATNLYGSFYAARAVIPAMQRQGNGHIIMVSSVAGKRVFRPEGGIYNVTKFAMQGLTEALRMELATTPIKVSAICPVVTLTEFFDQVAAQTGKKVVLQGPQQTADQVATAIVRLIRRPQAEVIMLPMTKLLLAINVFSPALADWLVTRFVK